MAAASAALRLREAVIAARSGAVAVRPIRTFLFRVARNAAFDWLRDTINPFFEEIAQAVEKWSEDVATDAEIQERIAGMVRIRETGFSPLPGIQIG